MRRVVLSLVCTLLTIPTLWAETLEVPEDYPTIQGAIEAALDGDVISVAPGTYVEPIDFLGKAITVEGRSGATLTTIDGGGVGNTVTFRSGESETSRLLSLTITGGDIGIFVDGASPLVEDCVVQNNTVGIDTRGAATIRRCQVQNNHDVGVAMTRGIFEFGRVHGNGSHGVRTSLGARGFVRDTIISSNAGRGILTDTGMMTISDNTITDNDGGVYSASLEVLERNVITLNRGRGVTTFYRSGGTIRHNLITYNGGGGIFIGAETGWSVTGNIIAWNVADRGAGIRIGDSFEVEFHGNTVYANHANLEGGGFYHQGTWGSLDIQNSILWDNEAPIGPEGYLWNVVEGLSVQYSDIKGGQASIHVQSGDVTWGPGNIDLDPQWENASKFDFRLKASSPCVDAGDPTLEPVYELDLYGAPRLLDGLFDGSKVLDIGAAEFDHVSLRVEGELTPGSSLTVETTGTAGLSVMMILGTAEGAHVHPKFGTIFVSFGSPYLFQAWGTVPSSYVLDIPSGIPTPLEIILQEIATNPGGDGNASNPVTVVIDAP